MLSKNEPLFYYGYHFVIIPSLQFQVVCVLVQKMWVMTLKTSCKIVPKPG